LERQFFAPKIDHKKIVVAEHFTQEMNKHGEPFWAAREKLSPEIEKLKKGLVSSQKNLAVAGALIAKEDFGLTNKPDGGKKIKQARKMFAKFFSDAKREIDDEISALNELGKHVEQLQHYKPPR
jgi:hypothetical protein